MSLISDMATITTIPVSTLEKLSNKCQACILHKLVESEKTGENITSIDIGIGTLYIQHNFDEIKYKFIPSRSFENNVKNTINTGESPLVYMVEEALREKITNAYKDLF